MHPDVKQGLARHKAGDHDAAAACYRSALAANPNDGQALHLLALLENDRGDTAAALAHLRAAVTVEPSRADAQLHLGRLLERQGNHADALEAFTAFTRLRPSIPKGYAAQAGALLRLGRTAEALGAYEHALALNGEDAGLRHDYGVALSASGRAAEAIAQWQHALAQRPHFPLAHFHVANALEAQQHPDEARWHFEQALAQQPEFPEAAFNLGRLHAECGRPAEALTHYRTAFRLRPSEPRIASALATALLDRNLAEEAQAVLTQAAAASGARYPFDVRAALALPRLPRSTAHIAEIRDRLTADIARLTAASDALANPPEQFTEIAFYLAYHGQDDRALMTALARLFRAHSPMLTYTAPHVLTAQQRTQGRIRVGFVSRFLQDHTIGRLNAGLIAGLDRSRFEVIVIHTSDARRDSFRQAIDASADAVVVLPSDLHGAQQTIAQLALDVLHYPDIGMSAFTYFLAFARLAPVQTVTWGHPVTTGIDTVDYFVSFAPAEPSDAQAHYQERLIRLARPAVHYVPPEVATGGPGRAELGLPASGALYGCLQSLFKFHPDFDAVLAEIVRRDPAGWIVVIGGHDPIWQDMLKARWREVAPAVEARVLFLPRVARERYLHLVQHMDVMVDPPHFGGGNTFYEAVWYGVPTVTWPSPYLRGRLAAGLIALMDLADPLVVADIQELGPLAVAVAHDRSRRAALRADLLAKRARIFADDAAVAEFGRFLAAAAEGLVTRWPAENPSS